MLLDNKKSISKINNIDFSKRMQINHLYFFMQKNSIFFYLYKNKLKHFVLEQEEKRRKNAKI
jgi:hypothetical protein